MPTGFLEGYLAVNQDQRAQDEAKIRGQVNQALLQEHQLELADMQRKQQTAEKVRAAAAQLPADKPLSDKYDALSNMILGIDPDKALDFSGRAIEQRDKEFKLAQSRKAALQTSMEQGADIASGIDSQDAADSLREWAKTNQVALPSWLPAEYNDQTAPAFQRFGKMFISAKDRLVLQRTQEQVKYQQDKDGRDEQRLDLQRREQDRRDAEQARREARDQTLWEEFGMKMDSQQKKKTAALDRDPTMTELASLAQAANAVAKAKGMEMPGTFGDEHMTIARDIYKRRNSLMKQDQELSKEDAEDTAIQETLSRVKDGKYTPKAAAAPAGKLKAGTSKQNPVVLDSQEAIDAAAKLPSGTWLKHGDQVVQKP